LVTGAISGGGAQNSAWALSSGVLAGQSAARRARAQGSAARLSRPCGQAGLRPSSTAHPVDMAAAKALVAREMHDTARNMFRDATTLQTSLAALDGAWRNVSAHAMAHGADRVRLRELAGMLAAARWSKAAALDRRETRGMHWREDAPQGDTALQARLTTGGLDSVWTRLETAARAVAA
jgi:succinate dehydrogenase/fumarate reductase flavoprotein subunit